MNIDAYAEGVRNELQMLVDYWKAGIERRPKAFPVELPEELWYEQEIVFRAYSEEQSKWEMREAFRGPRLMTDQEGQQWIVEHNAGDTYSLRMVFPKH